MQIKTPGKETCTDRNQGSKLVRYLPLKIKPITGSVDRLDLKRKIPNEFRPLIPVRARFFPGCLYLHDLALLNGKLLANAVGENAVVRVDSDGSYERVW